MNIIKVLKAQEEKGNNVVLKNGNIVSDAKVREEMLTTYFVGLRAGEISPTLSFNDYYAQEKEKCLTVAALIDLVSGPDDAVLDVTVEVPAEIPEEEPETEPEPAEEPESAEAPEEPKKPRRRTAKK